MSTATFKRRIADSDDLKSLRLMLRSVPSLQRQLGPPLQVALVVDASVVVADLRWLVKNRRSPSARSALQEAAASGTLVPIAPSFLNDEILKELDATAREQGLSHQGLLELWIEYRKMFTFRDGGGPSTAPATPASKTFDPKDLPYINAYKQGGVDAILTRDPHLARMGAPAVDMEIGLTMRDYARAASVELTIKVSGVVLLAAGAQAVVQLAIALRMLGKLIRAMKPEAQLALGAMLVLLLANRDFRRWLNQKCRQVESGISSFIAAALPVITEFASMATAAELTAESQKRAILAAISAGGAAVIPTHARVELVADPGTPSKTARARRRTATLSVAKRLSRLEP